MLLLAIALQVAAPTDHRFDELKAKTRAITEMIEKSSGPKPSPRNGVVYGAFRSAVSKDTMTDHTDVTLETKAIGGAANVTLGLTCYGNELSVVYRFNKPLVGSVFPMQMRIDTQTTEIFAGERTRDMKGAVASLSSLEVIPVGDGPRPIPRFVQMMLVGKSIRVRITPKVGSAVEHQFSLAGLSAAIRTLPCVE